MSKEATGRLLTMTPAQRDEATKTGASGEYLAVIEGAAFGSGVIEAEIAGVPQTGAFEGARGFVGIAVRVQDDLRTSWRDSSRTTFPCRSRHPLQNT